MAVKKKAAKKTTKAVAPKKAVTPVVKAAQETEITVQPVETVTTVETVEETTPQVMAEPKTIQRPSVEDLRKQQAVKDEVRGAIPFYSNTFEIEQSDRSKKEVEIAFFPYQDLTRVYAFWWDLNDNGQWSVQGRHEAIEPVDRTTNPLTPQQNFIQQRKRTMATILESIREEALLGRVDEFGGLEELDELSGFKG